MDRAGTGARHYPGTGPGDWRRQEQPAGIRGKDLEQDKYYDRIVKAFIPTQYAMTVMGAWLASRENTPIPRTRSA